MQIILFLILLLAIFILYMAKRDTLSKSARVSLIVAFFAVIFIGWSFNTYSQKVAQKNREILLAFQQGKTIKCKEYDVNMEDFIYVSGTLSFVAKDTKQELKGVVLDISECQTE